MIEFPFKPSANEILPFAVFILFGITWLIQMVYYWGVFSRLAFYRRKVKTQETPPVSVIICAKNEYRNLLQNLPLILEQDYPDYEVIVVNDASDDDTIELLSSFTRKYGHLRIFNLEQNLNFFSGKKFPLSLGIKSARHEILLLTDADCQPSGKEWIRKMMENYGPGTEIVLGYGTFRKTAGFLNQIIRYDAFLVAVQYLSFALSGSPYMGVGRNLSYKKNLFFKNGGFISHYKLKSGDDDLFINRVARRRNTRIEIHPEAHTISSPKSGFYQWILQKRRHYTTARFYRPAFKFLLSLGYISKLLLYLSFIALMVIRYNWMIILAAFSLFFISHWIILSFAANKMKENDLAVLSPIYEMLLLIISPLLYISNVVHKQERWK
ncbi:MAG: glycosyltransferase [Bacteroidales bacterium]|nr:glycosyltransferase [Bacteroidales bacterium]